MSGQHGVHMPWIPGKGFKFLGLLGLAEIALSHLKYKPAASLPSVPRLVQGCSAPAPPSLGGTVALALPASHGVTLGNASLQPHPYSPQLVMLEDFP